MPLYRSPEPGTPPGGSTAQVLAKASGTDFDTEWVDQSGGGSGPMDARITGRFYYPFGFNPGSSDGSGSFTANRAVWSLFDGMGYTYDAFCTWIRTGGTAGALIRFAIYSIGSDGYADALLLDGGTVAADVAAENTKTFTPLVIPGFVWVAMTCDDTAVRVTKSWNPINQPYGTHADDPSSMRTFLQGTGYPPGTAFPSNASTSGRSWGTEGPVCTLRRSA